MGFKRWQLRQAPRCRRIESFISRRAKRASRGFRASFALRSARCSNISHAPFRFSLGALLGLSRSVLEMPGSPADRRRPPAPGGSGAADPPSTSGARDDAWRKAEWVKALHRLEQRLRVLEQGTR